MSNKSYPRIIEIKEDGRIIAIDKYNKLNTDLNTRTLTDEQQYEIFGGILLRKNYKMIRVVIIMKEIIYVRKN